LGGVLADPATTLPDIFGPDSCLGFSFLQKYPYALPSLLNALFLTITTYIVFFGLEETLKVRKGKFDLGLHLAAYFRSLLWRQSNPEGYMQLQAWDASGEVLENFNPAPKASEPTQVLPFSRIWTRNVIFTLITSAFYDFQLGYTSSLTF
jgi:hypothetical protein